MFTATFREFVARHDRTILETAFHVPHDTVVGMNDAEVWDALQRREYHCYAPWHEPLTKSERLLLQQKKVLRQHHAASPDHQKRFGRALNEHKSRLGRLALKQAIDQRHAIKNIHDAPLPIG